MSCLKDHIDRDCFDLLTLFLWTRNKQTNRHLHQVLDSKHYIKSCCFGLSTALGATARVPWALWRTRATHTRRHHCRHGFGWENKTNNWIPGLKDESMSDCFQEKTNASTFKSLRALSSHGEISRKWYRWLGPTVTLWDSQWIPWGIPDLRSLRVASFRVSGYYSCTPTKGSFAMAFMFRLDKKTSLWGLSIEDIGATVIAVGKCTDANCSYGFKFPACQARSKFRWKWKKRLALVSGQQPMVCWCLWGIFEAPDNQTFFQGSALDDYKRSAARWDSAQSELCPKVQNKVWYNCYNCVV